MTTSTNPETVYISPDILNALKGLNSQLALYGEHNPCQRLTDTLYQMQGILEVLLTHVHQRVNDDTCDATTLRVVEVACDLAARAQGYAEDWETQVSRVKVEIDRIPTVYSEEVQS